MPKELTTYRRHIEFQQSLQGQWHGAFNIGGGTLRASASFASNVPLTLTGTGGDATIDTQGTTHCFRQCLGQRRIEKERLRHAHTRRCRQLSGHHHDFSRKLQVTGTISNLHAIAAQGNLSSGQRLGRSTLFADCININWLRIGRDQKSLLMQRLADRCRWPPI